MILVQNAPSAPVINDHLPSKENTSEKLLSVSTVYCLHTHALLRERRQLSIMYFVFCYIFICFFVYLIFGIGNFWMHFCLMLMYVNVAKLHLFNGLRVSIIGQD